MSQIDPGLHVISNFSKHAKALRGEFDAAFGDPLKATGQRFVWDYWNIPGQYTLLRTPLGSIFSEKSLQGFLDELSRWGQTKLGMTTISEPWLSCYVEGCEQRFHTDAGHGPWAFVYSLTPASFTKNAQGGFTRILRNSQDITNPSAREEGDLFDDVAPHFNRLTVFDPRRPHAVERVRGVQDVREARLVIHGWFTQPQPFYTAKLSKPLAAKIIKILEVSVSELLSDFPLSLQGLGVLRVSSQARVEWVSPLLVDLESRNYLQSSQKSRFLKALHAQLKNYPSWEQLCRELGGAQITFPFEVS